jgi:hypothetical protein
VATTLAMLDELLCRSAQWGGGREVHSVPYEDSNRLMDKERASLLP